MDRVDQLLHNDAGPVAKLHCGYRNASDRMVILRCCGHEQFYLERVVFPFEMLTFSCPAAATVEIWTHGLGGPELVECLTADDLLLMVPAPTVVKDLPFGESPWLESG